jgi:hypothetical protein
MILQRFRVRLLSPELEKADKRLLLLIRLQNQNVEYSGLLEVYSLSQAEALEMISAGKPGGEVYKESTLQDGVPGLFRIERSPRDKGEMVAIFVTARMLR